MLITDPGVPDPVGATRAALRGAPPGRVVVQARHKGASARALFALAAALLPVCRAAGARLVVNDRADVARAVGADGVHLPETGLSVAQARRVLGDRVLGDRVLGDRVLGERVLGERVLGDRVLGERALVGRSCHDRAGLERAQEDGADYALLAPVGAVPGKGPALGVAGFARAVAGLTLPVVALGSVEPRDASALRGAGAAGLAVVRAVYGADDPTSAVRELLRAFGGL